MPEATTTTQPFFLQGLRGAGAAETPPPSAFVTHPVQQAALPCPWASSFYLAAYYFAPQSILCRTL